MKTISSGPPGSVGGCGEDGGVDLAAVGVAFDGDVEGGEGGLCGVFDVVGEEDGSGAGAEGGGGLDEGLEDVEEAVAVEELEHGGGLAAGHDEAVEVGEFGWSADEPGGGAEGGEGFGVGFVRALQGEDADGERCVPRGHGLLVHRGVVVVLRRGISSLNGTFVFSDYSEMTYGRQRWKVNRLLSLVPIIEMLGQTAVFAGRFYAWGR